MQGLPSIKGIEVFISRNLLIPLKLCLPSQIWGLSVNKYIDRIFKIQKNALIIITKSEFNAHTNPLFRELKILKLVDQITFLNCLFVHDYLNKRLPKSFDNTFVKLDEMNSINTRN